MARFGNQHHRDSPTRFPRLDLLLDRVRTHDWIVPAVMVASAAGLAFTMDALDQVMQGRLRPVWWLFSGGHTTARQLLSAIAAAMVAIVTMSFSMTVAALTLVAQHYGTQVLRTFMRNLTTQLALGSFLATFVYALLVLRNVHQATDDASLPRFAITLGILLALASFGTLVYFLYHVSETMDAPNIVAAVAGDLERVIYRTTHPAASGGEAADETPLPAEVGSRSIESDRSGYLQSIDHDRLLALAESCDALVRVQCRIGRFVIAGDRLATVEGPQAGHASCCSPLW